MNTSIIRLRKALSRKTAALKTVIHEAAALDAARRSAIARARRAEKLVKKLVKLLRAERKVNTAERNKSESPEPEEEEPEVVLQRYKAFRDEYLQKKEKLDADLLEGNLTRKKHRVKLDCARIDMAQQQQHYGWPDWTWTADHDCWIQRKAECMAWHDQAADSFEKRYWRLVALAAESITEGNSAASIVALLDAAHEYLNDWDEVIEQN